MVSNKLPVFIQWSLYWLMMLTGLFIYSVIFQWLGIKISAYHLPICAGIGGFVCWLLSFLGEHRMSLFQLIVSFITFMGAVIGFGYLVSLVWEYSYLGRGVYTDGIVALSNGWNPFHDDAKKVPAIVYYSTRATWYINSCLYVFLGKYEMSKQLVLLFAMPAFCVTWECFKKFSNLKGWRLLFLVILSLCSPIALSQVFTFYDDAVMAYVIQCFLLLAYYMLNEGYLHNELLGGLASLWIFIFHMPQGGIRVAMLLLGSLLIAVGLVYKKQAFKWVSLRAGALFLFSAIFIGFQPLIRTALAGKNIVAFYIQNLLYTDLQFMPHILEGKSRLIQYALSFIASPDEIEALHQHFFEKILSVLTTGFAAPDVSLQGFGALSALLFILVIIALLFGMGDWHESSIITMTGTEDNPDTMVQMVQSVEEEQNSNENHLQARESILWIFGTCVLLVITSPTIWLARSTAISWFLIPLVMLLLVRKKNKGYGAIVKAMAYVAILNLGLYACATFPTVLQYSDDIQTYWQRMIQEELPTAEDAQIYNQYDAAFHEWTRLKQKGEHKRIEKAPWQKIVTQVKK